MAKKIKPKSGDGTKEDPFVIDPKSLEDKSPDDGPPSGVRGGEELQTIPRPTGITITSAKVNKHHQLKAVYTDYSHDGSERQVTLSCDAIVHPDLQSAFNELIPHLVILCDQKCGMEAEDFLGGRNTAADLSEYKVSGFTIGGSGESSGVTIIGRKDVGKKVVNLLSPFEKLESEYTFSGELSESVEKCKYEVQQYLDGKTGFVQTNLDFSSDQKDGVAAMEEALEEK